MTSETMLADLADEWELALPSIADDDRQLARVGLRLLAEGRPLDVSRLAQALNEPEAEVADRLSRLIAVYRDDQKRVIGIWGLFLIETPVHVLLEDRRLYALCAGDALFIPFVLNRVARIKSTDPTTKEQISMTVSPIGVTDIAPAGAAMSLVIPTREDISSGDPRGTVCHKQNFFASKQSAQAWVASHKNVLSLSIEDGFSISRWWAARLFGIGDARALDPRAVWMTANSSPNGPFPQPQNTGGFDVRTKLQIK